MTTAGKTKKSADPWDSDNPKPKRARKTLTNGQKVKAKASANKAGRPYPNLVDNMKVSRKAKTKKSSAAK